MGKGQPSNVTQTNKVELTPEQRELMGMGMDQIKGTLSGGTPQLPGVPGFDPLQTQAQQGVVDKYGSLNNMTSNIGNAQNFLSGDVMKVDSNPYLKGAIDAALRPITENFQNVVMPGIRGNAIQAGQLGSPKGNQRAVQGASTYMRQLGESSTTMANNAYGQNLEAMVRGLALAPQSQQAMLFPEAALESVGAQRRELTNQQGQQGFNQSMLPFNLGTQLISAAAGAPGAGSTSTVQGAQPSGGWTQLLGAGLSAASMLAGMPF